MGKIIDAIADAITGKNKKEPGVKSVEEMTEQEALENPGRFLKSGEVHKIGKGNAGTGVAKP